jgi:hypothetical protein
VTKNPPKILIAAKVTAINPNIFEKDMLLPFKELKDAIIAPTIITEEIALVTDIKGVWRDGVTLQTTKYPINIERIKMLSLNIKGSISIILFFN